MSIIGFIPNPETAATVVAWVQTLADEDEGTTYLCLETGFDGRTAQAVREALGDTGDSVVTLIAIDDPMPVARALALMRKRNIRLLVTAPFELPTVRRQAQTSEQLVRSCRCQTFALLYGTKAPSEIKRVLFTPTGQEHD
jgi:threonine synthase